MEGYVDNQMGSDEYGRLANYTRRQYPDVLEAQVREQPWFVKALGNPIVLGDPGSDCLQAPWAPVSSWVPR